MPSQSHRLYHRLSTKTPNTTLKNKYWHQKVYEVNYVQAENMPVSSKLSSSLIKIGVHPSSIFPQMSGQDKINQIICESLIQCCRRTSIHFWRVVRKNNVDWTRKADIRKAKFVTAGKACEATPSLKGATTDKSGFSTEGILISKLQYPLAGTTLRSDSPGNMT